MLEIRNLSVAYGQHQALEDVNLRVSSGEIVVILGANGAGKSTLLKSISGICEGQTEGEITLGGQNLMGLPPNQIVDEGIALVPEGRGIFGDLTVEENLTLGAYSERARDEEAVNLQRVYNLFPKLVERRRQIARTMSGGEQQMVAIGRAMMSNPSVLTLDEPSLGLSPLLCKELFANLKLVRELGIGILLVEQNARQSLAISDRGYLLENAKIVHEDQAEALMHDPAVQAAYLGAGTSAAAKSVAGSAPEPKHASETAAAADVPATAQKVEQYKISRPAAHTQTADAILGSSVSDLVARASKGSARAPKTQGKLAFDGVGAGPSADPLAKMIAEIEAAAQKARAARKARVEKPLPSQEAPSAAPPAKAARQKPVTLEIYRAPRVEIYRRRPGSTEFERD